MGVGGMLALVLGISVVGLITAWALARWVLSKGTGSQAMQAISQATFVPWPKMRNAPAMISSVW